MNCPICKNELEIKQKKVGETATGESIFNEFAICHNCKKQWNLDKQRAKHAAAESEKKEPIKKASAKPEVPSNSTSQTEQTGENRPVKKRKKRPVAPVQGNESPVSDATKIIPTEDLDAALQERPRKVKKKRAPETTDTSESLTVNDAAPEKKAPVKKRRPVQKPSEQSEPTDMPEAIPDRPRKVKRKRPVAEPLSDTLVLEKTLEDTLVKEENTPNVEKPRRKKRPRPTESDFNLDDLDWNVEPMEENTYSNIPPKHIRETREQEMRENYQNMLDEDNEDEEKKSPIILILIIIIILLAIAAFAGYWFLLR